MDDQQKNEIFVEMKQISKRFGGVQALDQVDLTIRRGEVHCLAGENGCGKSTLIKILAGVETPDEGEILVQGTSRVKITPIEAIHEGIQVIYQDLSVFPNLTVAENIAINKVVANNRRLVKRKEIEDIARTAMEMIHVDFSFHQRVEELKIADRQLIAIMRAIVQKAKVIVMDEATTALTAKEITRLFEIVENVRKQGISVLFVSHKMDEVFEISEQITILRNGKLIRTDKTKNYTSDSMIYAMTGRKIEPGYLETKIKQQESIVEIKDLTLKGAYSHISFQVSKGEILGIAGLRGGGRTELAMSLFGLCRPEHGEIILDGQKIQINSVQDALGHGICYVPENRLTEGLFLNHSIESNISVTVLDQLKNKLSLVPRKKEEELSDHWIKTLSVATPNGKISVGNLSGGNQQKVVLSKWIAMDPKLLILNGPTVGVDIGAKDEIHKVLKNLADRGIGIIMISDDLRELAHYCHRVVMMYDNRIAEEWQGEELYNIEESFKNVLENAKENDEHVIDNGEEGGKSSENKNN